MKKKFFLLCSLLLSLLTCCTQDSMDEDLRIMNEAQEQELDAILADYDLLTYGANDSGVVPNGECLIGAIMSAGKQFGIRWEYREVKLYVDNYLNKPSLDMNGNVIGNPSDSKTLEKFLHSFFGYVRIGDLNNVMVQGYLGNKITVIAIVKNYDEQNTGHAYNVIELCTKHKNNCFICYDPVLGYNVHIRSSEFADRFTFVLSKPKIRPAMDKQ